MGPKRPRISISPALMAAHLSSLPLHSGQIAPTFSPDALSLLSTLHSQYVLQVAARAAALEAESSSGGGSSTAPPVLYFTVSSSEATSSAERVGSSKRYLAARHVAAALLQPSADVASATLLPPPPSSSSSSSSTSSSSAAATNVAVSSPLGPSPTSLSNSSFLDLLDQVLSTSSKPHKSPSADLLTSSIDGNALHSRQEVWDAAMACAKVRGGVRGQDDSDDSAADDDDDDDQSMLNEEEREPRSRSDNAKKRTKGHGKTDAATATMAFGVSKGANAALKKQFSKKMSAATLAELVKEQDRLLGSGKR